MRAHPALLPRLASFAPCAAIALLSLSPGCRTQQASSVLLVISSEPEIGAQIASLVVQTSHGGQENFINVTLDPDSTKLPGTLALFDNPNDDVDPSVATKITLEATLGEASGSGSSISIKRDIFLDHLEHDQRVIRVALRYACSNFNDDCPLSYTCVAGSCQPASFTAADLEPYAVRNIFPIKQEGDPCFADEEAECFKGSQELEASALELSGEECFLKLPDVGEQPLGARKLNVGLLWDAAPGRYITLDNEARVSEGWAFADPSGYRIKLPVGYCSLAGAKVPPGRARLLYVRYSYACDPKPVSLPLCQPPGAAQGQRITPPKSTKPAATPDGGAGDGGPDGGAGDGG
jgi:hypothetical protein